MPATDAMRELAAEPPWRDRLAGVGATTGPRAASPVLAPERYIDVLSGAGLAVDAWQTTYYHVLSGPDPVLEWFAGTGLRPYLRALAPDETAVAAFRDELAHRLRKVVSRAPVRHRAAVSAAACRGPARMTKGPADHRRASLSALFRYRRSGQAAARPSARASSRRRPSAWISSWRIRSRDSENRVATSVSECSRPSSRP